MKLLSDINLSDKDVNNQLKVTQTLSKINTLMDVADGLKEWEGVQRIEIFLMEFFFLGIVVFILFIFINFYYYNSKRRSVLRVIG